MGQIVACIYRNHRFDIPYDTGIMSEKTPRTD